MLIPVIDLATRSSTGRDLLVAILLEFRYSTTGKLNSYPTKVTMHPPPREKVGASLAGY